MAYPTLIDARPSNQFYADDHEAEDMPPQPRATPPDPAQYGMDALTAYRQMRHQQNGGARGLIMGASTKGRRVYSKGPDAKLTPEELDAKIDQEWAAMAPKAREQFSAAARQSQMAPSEIAARQKAQSQDPSVKETGARIAKAAGLDYKPKPAPPALPVPQASGAYPAQAVTAALSQATPMAAQQKSAVGSSAATAAANGTGGPVGKITPPAPDPNAASASPGMQAIRKTIDLERTQPGALPESYFEAPQFSSNGAKPDKEFSLRPQSEVDARNRDHAFSQATAAVQAKKNEMNRGRYNAEVVPGANGTRRLVAADGTQIGSSRPGPALPPPPGLMAPRPAPRPAPALPVPPAVAKAPLPTAPPAVPRPAMTPTPAVTAPKPVDNRATHSPAAMMDFAKNWVGPSKPAVPPAAAAKPAFPMPPAVAALKPVPANRPPPIQQAMPARPAPGQRPLIANVLRDATTSTGVQDASKGVMTNAHRERLRTATSSVSSLAKTTRR